MNNHNEKNILISYLKDCNTIKVYSNQDMSKKLNCIFNNIIQHNKPDMYSIFNNQLIMIEHFEFDSYDHLKKGSDYRTKEANFRHKFDKELSKRCGKEITCYDTISSTATVENYINNFINVFDDHYKKINIYKSRFETDKYDKLETWFFIEDISPLGSYLIDNNRNFRYMIIFQFSKIINYLLKHQRVDRIIYGFFDGNRRRLIVLDNKREILNSIAMDYGMADKSQHYWFEANVFGFSIPILKFEE